ncbi:MAG: hypothetical protein IJ559_00250 [Prevotella sp.]|nr:hypothetical protein [Prevotella sp.]
MINEEQYIKSKVGGTNPFRVPDGYFDNLTAQVMQQLPERHRQSLVVRLRPWFYAAACFLAVLFTAAVYFYSPDTSSRQVATNSNVTVSESYIDEAADFVMADNNDIYACLASEY